jgi:CrcB protein
MPEWIAVIIGGAVGSLTRFLVAARVQASAPGAFPSGTLAVNLIGCFAIGVVARALDLTGAAPIWRAAFVTGFLGGFTTFSSFAWETLTLWRTEAGGLAMVYILVSTLGGFVLAIAGFVTADMSWRAR